MPTPITNGLKDIFLAGIGAMAITGEKASEVVDKLIARGELTVDQGKEINKELQHKAEGALEKARAGSRHGSHDPGRARCIRCQGGRDRRKA